MPCLQEWLYSKTDTTCAAVWSWCWSKQCWLLSKSIAYKLGSVQFLRMLVSELKNSSDTACIVTFCTEGNVLCYQYYNCSHILLSNAYCSKNARHGTFQTWGLLTSCDSFMLCPHDVMCRHFRTLGATNLIICKMAVSCDIVKRWKLFKICSIVALLDNNK